MIAEMAGSDDVNLVQKAYYNGHYGFHGAKVQHMVQADGIMMSFVALIRNHDAKVIMSSNMFTMVNTLYVDGQPNRPVKCVTDKAYLRNEYFRPAFTNTELCAMPPLERDQAKVILKQNNKKRIVVEFIFNNILTKYNHFDWF